MIGKSLVSLIRVYQATKFLRTPTCRFYPSCSEYTAEAISKHGAAAGLAISAARLAKCHPFHDGGVDPVPASINWHWTKLFDRPLTTKELRREF